MTHDQQTLEAEMDAVHGATKGERTEGRVGYYSGYYGRTLITRVGQICPLAGSLDMDGQRVYQIRKPKRTRHAP